MRLNFKLSTYPFFETWLKQVVASLKKVKPSINHELMTLFWHLEIAVRKKEALHNILSEWGPHANHHTNHLYSKLHQLKKRLVCFYWNQSLRKAKHFEYYNLMDKRWRHIPDGLSPQLARPLLEPTLPVYFYCEVSNSVKNRPKNLTFKAIWCQVTSITLFSYWGFFLNLCEWKSISSLHRTSGEWRKVWTFRDLIVTKPLCVVNETPFSNMQHNLNSISLLVILICSSKYSNPHLLATNLPLPESSTERILGELHILSLGVKNQVQCFHCFIWRWNMLLTCNWPINKFKLGLIFMLTQDLPKCHSVFPVRTQFPVFKVNGGICFSSDVCLKYVFTEINTKIHNYGDTCNVLEVYRAAILYRPASISQ